MKCGYYIQMDASIQGISESRSVSIDEFISSFTDYIEDEESKNEILSQNYENQFILIVTSMVHGYYRKDHYNEETMFLFNSLRTIKLLEVCMDDDGIMKMREMVSFFIPILLDFYKKERVDK